MSTQTEFLAQTHWGEAGGSGWPKFGSVLEIKDKIFKAVQEVSTTFHIPGFLATTSGALQWLFFYLYYFFLLLYSRQSPYDVILFGLSTFLVNINDFLQSRVWVRSYSYATAHHIFLILSLVSFWKFMKWEQDSFHFSWVYSLPGIKNSNTELLLWLWKNSISDILNKDSRLSKIFFVRNLLACQVAQHMVYTDAPEDRQLSYHKFLCCSSAVNDNNIFHLFQWQWFQPYQRLPV